ncbi:MAG: glycosyltransferase [Cyanobacteria bacterium J06631_9]
MLLSTPVGPLGSGLGGGVELTVANLARVMVSLGHQVTIVTPAEAVPAPLGLRLSAIKLVQVAGEWQQTAQAQPRSAASEASAVLKNMWAYAQQSEHLYDVMVNFAYDWLPFELTSALCRPVAHFVSMGSLSDQLDVAIARVVKQFPGTLGAYTQSQSETFAPTVPPDSWKILGGGIDLTKYRYCPQPEGISRPALAWVGRISPEKGLEDAIAAARLSKQPLQVFGKIEDKAYWRRLQSQAAWWEDGSPIEYCGFLPTAQLQKALGRCRALLLTSHWVEAFGMVVVEAFACGVPVIAYDCGGPGELVKPGKTGWLVPQGQVSGLVDAITKIDQLNRADCREQAETVHALSAWGERMEDWLYQVIADRVSDRLSS